MSEKVKKKKTLLQKILIGVAIFMAAVIFIVGSYVAYVFIAFHRLGDYDVTPGGNANLLTATVGTDYSVISYNVGFGAYEVDYDFFMDGGTQSWAKSKDGLIKNLENITDLLKAQNADMYLLQEIDYDSTRTYHVDEREYFINALENKSYTFAQNYDSPFLFYPFYQPHGASKSGIMVFSPFKINSARRIELPIETGVTRIIDYDRCYVKNRVSVSNGKELIIYTFHLSAYTSDGSIATEQLKVLLEDIQAEYDAGNYCFAGGDFNKDLLGDDAAFTNLSDGKYNWAQTIPEGTFDDYNVRLVAPNNGVPSCRNADSAYHERQYIITIDGFLATDNVSMTTARVIDTGFLYSDHNPVITTFRLL